MHALLVLRDGLLRYVAEQLAAGKTVVLPGEHTMQVDVLRRFMMAIAPTTYAELVGHPGILEEAERTALEHAVKELGFKPGAPEPSDANTVPAEKGPSEPSK